jgi:exodeoxyribonuclease VII small subunit
MKGVLEVASNGAAKRQDQNGKHAVPDSLPSFEVALDELDKAVASLESGDLELDEALALFERGMRLAHVCQEALDRAELRVRMLVESEAGSSTPRDVPFDEATE